MRVARPFDADVTERLPESSAARREDRGVEGSFVPQRGDERTGGVEGCEKTS